MYLVYLLNGVESAFVVVRLLLVALWRVLLPPIGFVVYSHLDSHRQECDPQPLPGFTPAIRIVPMGVSKDIITSVFRSD
jgi:hypothetical protein